MLENYVLALGIRGFGKWSEKWVRIYRGMPEEDIQSLNEYREKFVAEVQSLALGFQGGKKKYVTIVIVCTSLSQNVRSKRS